MQRSWTNGHVSTYHLVSLFFLTVLWFCKYSKQLDSTLVCMGSCHLCVHVPITPFTWTKNAGQIRVESGFDPVNTFHMRGSTPDIKAGRTLLPTLGRIRIKDGGPWSYVARRRSEGLVRSLVGGADTGSTCGSIQERNSVPDDFFQPFLIH